MLISRSSKCSLKFTNAGKLLTLRTVLEEYGRVCNAFIEQFWALDKPPSKSVLLKPVVDSVDTWLSARLRKVAAREAIDLVSSSKKSALALKKTPGMPVHSGRSMHVSSTIVRLEQAGSATEFDSWLHLSSIGKHPTTGKSVILDFPIRKHKHFNRWERNGKRCNDYIIREDSVQFSFQLETGPKKSVSSAVGIDTGIKSLGSTSSGAQYGRDIEKFVQGVARRKSGSKSKTRAIRALRQRMDEVCIELFNEEQPDLVVVEKLRQLNYKTRVRRRLTKNMRRSIGSWPYRYWLGRVERECEHRRSVFRSVNPAYTSQTCNQCGHVDRKNRSRESFRCLKCGHSDNADLNAAQNILDRFLSGPYGAGFKPEELSCPPKVTPL